MIPHTEKTYRIRAFRLHSRIINRGPRSVRRRRVVSHCSEEEEILAQQPLWEVRGRRRAELEVTTLCTLLKYVCTPMHCGCWVVIVMQDTRELKG